MALMMCLLSVTIVVSSTFHCRRLSHNLLMPRQLLSRTPVIILSTSTLTQRYFVFLSRFHHLLINVVVLITRSVSSVALISDLHISVM